MILKIKSENNNLLDLLFKNPNTDEGLYFKPLKNGQIVGNAIDKNNYEIVFQDTKYSYLPEDSNQIDFQSYCNPYVVLHICNELFSHILKDKESYLNAEISWLKTTQGNLDTIECSIEIPTFYIHSGWYRNNKFLLAKYFEGIEVTQSTGRNFRLKIVGKNVFEAMNLLNLVALFTHITNEYGVYTYIDDSFALKYVRILTNLENVPYFVFYLFIKRAIKSERQFEGLKPILEEYLAKQGLKANLTFYDTHQDRIRFICSHINLENDVLDVGCGEFIYFKKIMALEFKNTYHAVDIEAKFETLAKIISERYLTDKLVFYNTIEKVNTDKNLSVIMTEVIEHNSIEDSQKLILKTLELNVEQLIITTPNKNFNQFYFEHNEEMRHHDHHFEFTENEFKNFIESTIPKNTYKVSYYYIGDTLNNVQPTQACIIKKM